MQLSRYRRPEADGLLRPLLASAPFRRWMIVLAHLLLMAVALVPVASVDVPALVDYPNHLARLHILATIEHMPALQEHYAVEWAILPNLAMDALLPALTRFMSIFDAGRLFIAATLLLLTAGTLALHRVVHGHVGLWSTTVYLFLFNHVLVYGFLNYLFAIGLCLLILAGWIAATGRPFWMRLGIFSIASIALFFAHLLALGVYGLCITAYELWRMRQRGDVPRQQHGWEWAAALGQFLIPALLLLWSPTGDSALVISFGSIAGKTVALASPVLAYSGPVDTALFIIVGIFLIRALLSRRLVIAPELRYPIILLALLAAVMPSGLFSVWLADIRLPVVLAFLLVAGSRFEPGNSRLVPIVIAVAVALFGIKIWTVAETWRAYDRQFTEFRQAASAFDEGARLLVVQNDRSEDRKIWKTFDAPYWHMAALAVIERSVFLPFLFTDPTKQPLRVTEAYKSIDTTFGHPISPKMLRDGADPAMRLDRVAFRAGYNVYWADWPKNFDYVLFVHFGDAGNPMPDLLQPVRSGSFFTIYRIMRR